MKVVSHENLGLDWRRNALSPAQRAILDVRLKGEGTIADVAVTKKRASGKFIPLTPNQHRLWLHQQLTVESASYHLGLGVRIRGEVRSELLELCLNRLIERHDALRMTFRVVSGEPVQIVSEPFVTSLPVVDLSSLPDGEREEAVAREASSIRSQAFDLEVGPLFRVRLLKCGPSEFVFLMVTHHIVSDGWSQGIVMRDLAAMYSAEIGKSELRLPKLEMQFSNYAWEHNEKHHNELRNERTAAWWKDTRSGVARLPFDKPQPGTTRSRTIVRSRKLVPALLLGLGDIAKQNGTTVYVILLAAFGVFLRRYTGQTEFLILSPTANRDRAETANIVGFLANTLWLRVEVPADRTFTDYVKDVHRALIRAYEFQDISPPLAVLGTPHEGQADIGADAMQLGFFFDNSPTPGLNTAGFTINRQAFAKAEAKFALALNVQTNLAVPSIGFEFRPELFAAATVEGMLSNFWHLLQGIVCNADRRLSALPLLDEAERHRLVVEWNDTAAGYPSEQCLHDLFAAQVARTPDAVATTYEDRCLSYGELDRRSNQLAHHLRSLGVGPEVIVGLCVERSPEMVIGLLGILKAGGAYLPLDPSYPPERLGYMVADAAAPILVTQASLMEQLPPCAARLVRVDADWEEIARQRQELPASGTCAENLAYVIYTSGSTGKPKGALGLHRGPVSRLHWDDGRGADEVYAHKTTLNFIDAIWELFMPLIRGGRTVLVREAAARDPASLIEMLSRHGTTRLVVVPSLLRALLHSGRELGAAWPSLGYVSSGGEPLPVDVVEQCLRSLPGVKLLNFYGTSEFWDASWYDCGSGFGLHGVPLGRPLGNMRLYVLDEWLEVLPLGARGELYVGGVGLARGYLKRAALTAERFVPSPFGSGERLYRTGDLARWRADGELEFLGRVDHQVKLRGYRIELGEIEAVLRSHDGVKDAVVVAREDEPGAQRLVAYVVGSAAALPPEPSVLRAHVKASLPDYMVPSAFVAVAELPLTPNGKIDRKALPAPAGGEGIVQAAYEAARSPTEEVLAGIWCEVLKLDRVGVHDNFFELGGHSLLATRVTARLREAFGIELALRAVFEAPTLQRLAAHVEALRRQAAATPLPPLQARPRPHHPPLSFAQERLWLLERLETLAASYNIPMAVRLQGRLDVAALEQSLAEVVRRHEALRTRFAVMDAGPVQVVDPPTPFRLEVTDLMELAATERAAAARRRTAEIVREPFDLERGPLLRAVLLRLSDQEHVAVVVVHHIVSDGWSMGILIREVVTLYAAYVAGLPSPLADLSVQYADYAIWQRQWLRGEVLAQQIAYWRERLAGAPAALDLPSDRVRPAVQSFRGAVHRFAVPVEVTRALGALARCEGATLFMVLLAAFQMVLSRWSGQQDIVIGTPIAGRTHRQTENLIGFFVNMLALRTDVSGDPSFRALVRRVKEVALAAYAHQDLPFEKLVEELRPVRDLSRQPLFQVLFALQNVPREELRVSDLVLRPIGVDQVTAKLDLSLYLHETPEGLRGVLEYATDLFESATIARVAGYFVTLLEAIVGDADRRLSALPLLGDAERHRLLVEWNDTAAEYPSERCLHDLFAAQVARTPDAVAVTYEDRCLSYGELDRRANQLAHYLRGLGVGPEIVVGLCVERSLDMVIGLLGILKAGGAYLPLDPSYPPERLGYMVADAAAPILVTQASLMEQLPRCDARLVRVDADREEIARQRQEMPASGTCAENLAYVIYTSGSTGKPKGAMIRHCAVVNLLFALRQRLGFTAEDVVLAVTRFSFDMSVPEFYLPLLLGGSVALQSRQAAGSGVRLNAAIRDAGATVMQATPTSWSMLLDAGWRATDGLRVWCGGEAFPAHLAAALNVAGAEIWNLYGPTETTVWSSASRLVPGCGVSLGRPLGNMRLYVLDEWLEVLPLGARGELYVGGVGLARGYLKRAALTAERFVPSPFGSGERLYRTGDLARWRADGELEFLGRVDHQVKLRGYRIELGEIEAVLRSHDGVKDAVVVAREDEPGAQRLVAYVVGSAAALPPEPSVLRAHVKASLPDYMVPSAFVAVAELPLTPNGKIDRKALPAPAGGEGIVQAAYEAARSPTEEVLAGIWCEVLKLDRVRVHDNFFELGGHSLLATRVTARLREAFGIELALRAVFEAPTLQRLAAHVEALRRQAAATPLPPLQARPRPQQLPLSFEQERLWLLDRLFPESMAQNLPLAVRVHGPFDVTALERSLEEIAQRHSVLRSRFPAIDGRPQQIVSQSASIAVTRIDLTDLAPANRREELHARLIEQHRRHFDLERDPPIRICVFELGNSDHVLSATIHHIAADGESLGIFVRELEHLYRAFSRSEEPSLPELPIQYADFAAWQRTTFPMEPIQAQLRYWTDTLRGAPPSIALPIDRMRPARMTFAAAARSTLVPKELAGSLVSVAHGRRATLFMILLAALKLVLFRWTGQKDLVVGTVMGSRRHVATEDLIGCFMNFLPLRSILSEPDTFSAILDQCRDTVLQAYSNLDCPFVKIIGAVNPPRRLNQTPLYNVGLLLQNFPKQLATGDGSLSRIFLPNGTAQLDLRFIATEIDNGILIECEYGTELFEAATIGNLLDFYVSVLELVSNAPDIHLADVPLSPVLAAQVVMSGEGFGSTASDKADNAILELLTGIESLSEAEAEIGAATALGLRDEHVG